MKTIYEGLKRLTVATLIAVLTVLPLASQAELTATVYPGYSFASGERPTMETLNLLGRPIIVISGTLGGTNVALGAGTVSGTMLMDSVAGAGLDWDGNSPRGLMIGVGGVGLVHLASTNFGAGLTNTGTTIRVAFDTTLKTNAQGQLGVDPTTAFPQGTFSLSASNFISTNTFTSFTYSLPASSGTVMSTNHSLGRIPVFIRAVLVCSNADNGYLVGDEIDVSTVAGGGGNSSPYIIIGGNSTNVFAYKYTADGLFAGPSGTATLTASKWNFKIYARP
jgi:hypothetical protein